jgi:CDP-diacylglycerol--glycerol-3-phosphate 3-phosphatidyltransferase
MNFPNALSLLRIILAPVFLILFLSDSYTSVFISFIVYSIAALTDWYDGWYARKYGYKTKWGQFIDPLADKILTSAAFIGLYLQKLKNPDFMGSFEPVPIIILIGVIILRDIILTIIRSIQEIRGIEFRTSFISKTKTFIQMLYIFLILAFFALYSVLGNSETKNLIKVFLNSEINYYLLFFIAIITAASGIAYLFESEKKFK